MNLQPVQYVFKKTYIYRLFSSSQIVKSNNFYDELSQNNNYNFFPLLECIIPG